MAESEPWIAIMLGTALRRASLRVVRHANGPGLETAGIKKRAAGVSLPEFEAESLRTGLWETRPSNWPALAGFGLLSFPAVHWCSLILTIHDLAAPLLSGTYNAHLGPLSPLLIWAPVLSVG